MQSKEPEAGGVPDGQQTIDLLFQTAKRKGVNLLIHVTSGSLEASSLLVVPFGDACKILRRLEAEPDPIV